MDFVDSLFSFLFFMLMSISLTTAQLECYNTGNFTTNSTYGKNRNLILSSLASNVTAHGRFYTATVGQDPNKVYALGVCREDYSLESCASCVRSATEDMLTNCPNQKEALSWGLQQTPCTVRYADRSFLEILELDPMTAGYNVGNITTNLTQFDQTWESLMDRVLNKASKGSSRLKFATGEANLTYFQKIYALMQCTPDLSPTNCDTCLRQSLANFQSCCHGKQGGYVLRPNCNFRWDLYPFYEISANAPSPSPPIAKSAPSSQFTNTSREKGGIQSLAVVIIVVCTIFFIALVVFTCIFLRRKAQKQIRNKKETTDAVDEIETVDSLQFDFSTIRVATGDFSVANKLGQGGFGAVYKGMLPNGQDIAVKRLCRDSRQGEQEFKNEVLLVAKLQHRNLVRLQGFCLEGEEKLLIFEFVPNLSLDNLLFDPTKRSLLDWKNRWKIIGGVARGMLYLHEDSRFRIIHRDLKASNILLDGDMNPKISDFGLARMFELDKTQDNTSRVVGTFGYMAPEYLSGGHFSVKSDVFSFGVLVLEIMSGQRNRCFHNGEEAADLLTYAWKNWNEGTPLNLIDPILSVGSSSEMMRCIHIGLLCVQANAANRPTMATVVLMLNSFTLSLPVPSEPAFFLHTTPFGQGYSESTMSSSQPQRNVVQFSVNEVSITELDPR